MRIPRQDNLCSWAFLPCLSRKLGPMFASRYPVSRLAKTLLIPTIPLYSFLTSTCNKPKKDQSNSHLGRPGSVTTTKEPLGNRWVLDALDVEPVGPQARRKRLEEGWAGKGANVSGLEGAAGKEHRHGRAPALDETVLRVIAEILVPLPDRGCYGWERRRRRGDRPRPYRGLGRRGCRQGDDGPCEQEREGEDAKAQGEHGFFFMLFSW